MTKTIQRRVALFFVALFTGLLALIAFRSLATATVAAVLSGLSAQAIAGTAGAGKAGAAGAAAGGVHLPAFVGALMGALLQLLQLKGRPLLARIIITGVSFGAAYFAGTWGAQRWELEPGGVGVLGTAAAYIVVPVLDALRALLGDVFNTLRALLADIPWIKRLLFRRVTGEADNATDA